MYTVNSGTRGTHGNSSWLIWDARSESWVEYVAPLTSDEVLEVLFADRDRKVYERTGMAAVVVDGALTTLAAWATRVCVVLAIVTVAVLWWEWIHGWR